jgi:drug/metabolite transporter (DMT)-like permease
MNSSGSGPNAPSGLAWVDLMPAVFVLIWSTGFIVARLGMPYAPPMGFLMWRYALSIACFLVWIRWARVAWPSTRDQWWHLSVSGVLMHAGYLGGVWSSVKAGMGAGLVALIVGLQPVLTAVWLSSRGGAVSRRQWLGLWLGLAGLMMVVWRKLGSLEVSWWTLCCATTALLSITIGTLYQKRHVQPCDRVVRDRIRGLASAVDGRHGVVGLGHDAGR